MTTTFCKFVLTCVLVTAATGAWAAPRDHHNRDRDDDRSWQHHDDDRRGDREQWRRDRDWQRQRDWAWQRQQEAELRRRADHHPYYNPGHYPPRYGYRNRWERGHRYNGPVYVVQDYGYYHLRRPPYGYHWVQADNRYLLVAIATGLILDIASR